MKKSFSTSRHNHGESPDSSHDRRTSGSGQHHGPSTSHRPGQAGNLQGTSNSPFDAHPAPQLTRRDGQPLILYNPRRHANLRLTDEQMAALFKRPDLPENALGPRNMRFSQILIHPAPAGLRKDGTIMRSWQTSAMPGEFRKNNNCLKVSAGAIANIGREPLNISNEYWQWLNETDSTHPSSAALGRRNILCDEQHNKDDHSQDGRFFACPFEHDLADPQWTHGYEHIVCRNCEACQPGFCAPIVQQMLTEGPLVAMCEKCAARALAEYGPGYNGCECTRGAFGGMCLQHQDSEASHLARKWLEYRTLHHGAGGYDSATAQDVVVPVCKCDRAPVGRSRAPFAFWCAACEQPVVLPANAGSWQPGRTPQRWLRLANLPPVDYGAPYARAFSAHDRAGPAPRANTPSASPPPPPSTPPGRPAMTSMGAPPPGAYTNAPRPRHAGVVPGGRRHRSQWSSSSIESAEAEQVARRKQPRTGTAGEQGGSSSFGWAEPRQKLYSDEEEDEDEGEQGSGYGGGRGRK